MPGGDGLNRGGTEATETRKECRGGRRARTGTQGDHASRPYAFLRVRTQRSVASGSFPCFRVSRAPAIQPCVVLTKYVWLPGRPRRCTSTIVMSSVGVSVVNRFCTYIPTGGAKKSETSEASTARL